MIVIIQDDQPYIAESVHNDSVGSVIASKVRSARGQNRAPYFAEPYFVAYGPEAEKMTFYGTFRVVELKP